MRLIDADALGDKVADLYTEGEEATEADKVVNDVIDLIDNAPTVEQSYQMPKDYIKNKLDYLRPRGEWIEHYDNSDGFTWLTCSRCMFKAYEEDYNFCPNCGADMRKESEDE